MAERVDVVVVGAGLGGLAAAVALARAGRRVVVLEQHSEAGGYASAFYRGPYRFDTALHALNGLAPGGGGDQAYRLLGIADRLRLHRLDPLYVLRGGGREIVAHADEYEYEEELVRAFPRRAEGIRTYLDEAFAVYRDTRRLEVDSAAGRTSRLEDLVARYPALVRASSETWAELIGRHVADVQVRSALGALWAYVGLPPSQCAATVGAAATGSYHQHGGWYPEGGSRAIAEALAQVLREHDGELRFGHLVTGFDVEAGRAVAVTTHEGMRLEAPVFVSNASAPTTVLDLVGADHLPGEYVDRVAAPRPSYATFAVYLGLGRDVFGEQGLPHELFLDPALDVEAGWQASQLGDWAHSALAVTDYTRVDPGCAPPGHAVVVLTTAARWDHEDTWGTGGDLLDYHRNPRYLEVKEQVAEALVARAAAEVPGLASAIRYREASTPLSNFHYTRNPYGAIEGFENTPANVGPGRLRQRTPLPNLFLAGAWTTTGGMNPSLLSGVNAARLALAATPVTA
jgi:prolycopene isomerase